MGQCRGRWGEGGVEGGREGGRDVRATHGTANVEGALKGVVRQVGARVGDGFECELLREGECLARSERPREQLLLRAVVKQQVPERAHTPQILNFFEKKAFLERPPRMAISYEHRSNTKLS